MPRLNLGIDAALFNGKERIFGLELVIGSGAGPTSLTFRPGRDADGQRQGPFSLKDIFYALAEVFDIPELKGVADLADKEPWGKFFRVKILPELTVIVAPQASSIQARFQLFNEKGNYGLTFSDYLPSFLTIEPDITLFDLIIGYWQEGGLDLRARVKIPPQKSAKELQQGSILLGAPPPEDKTEIIKYPFPTPSTGGQTFRVNYLGLGQRFGPPPLGLESDPIKIIFDELIKNLRSNDPAQLLQTLVKDYYRPDRNWFIAADLYVKGWQVQAIFNDPALYGIRITCDTGKFEGLKFEILYQRLGPDLAVYYGGISLPEKFRQINLGAVALTLPSFEIWIYTNGDFKVSVGWPLGPNSIGFEIYIFIGGCAFYFAKLRSGFDPRAQDPEIYYEPILAFGLAIKIGLGRSIRKGVFQAELSLTLQGVFQGILAWRGVKPENLVSKDPVVRDAARLEVATSSGLSGPPDYFWFSATVGVVGLLQGSVDLKIIKASISIRLAVTIGIAFETDYGTIAQVTAEVSVTAKIKIVFITIKASFSATIRETFDLSKGQLGQASIEGPKNCNFQGIVPNAARECLMSACTPVRLVYSSLHIAQDAAPAPVTIHMALLSSVVYAGAEGVSHAVAIPMIGTPNETHDADYNVLLQRLARWLLRVYSQGSGTWVAVVETLRQGSQPPPEDFAEQLDKFLAEEFEFTFVGVDLSQEAPAADWSPLPMFPKMQMTVTGQEEPIIFDAAKTPEGYENEVRRYFEALSLAGLTSNPGEPIPALEAVAATGPSVAQIAFQDFYLMISRDLAQRMLDTEEQSLPGEIDTAALDDSVDQHAVQVAGMASQTMLGGVLMPDPSQVGIPLEDMKLGGLYALSLQQFPVDLSVPVNSASFSLGPDPSLLGRELASRLTEDTPVVAYIPVEPAPPSPAPSWSNALTASEATTIQVSQIPSVASGRLWMAARELESWDDLGDPSRVLLANTELQTLAEQGPLKLFAQTVEPKENQAPNPDLTVTPCLFIQLPIRRVALNDGGQVSENGDTAPELLRNVYQISTTDDTTRARIGEVLDLASTDGLSLDLIFDVEGGGYKSAPTAAPENQTFLYKTNLSTLTQPENMTLLSARAQAPEADRDTATIADIDGFLRLIWEASVVNSAGFFLFYADADGNGLPDSGDDDIFGDEGSATITVVLRSQPESAFDRYHNAMQLPEKAQNTVFIAVDREDDTPVEAANPAYPAGCVGFQLDWGAPPSSAIAEQENPPPYAEKTIAALYEYIQYQVAATQSEVDFKNSLWSLPLTRSDDKADGVADKRLGSYRNVAPVYRFATNGNGGIYDAVGGMPELAFRLLDTYGNVLGNTPHTAPFKVLYNDPLIPVGEWPGVRSTYFVGKDSEDGDAPSAFVVLGFDPSEIVREDVHEQLSIAQDEEDPGVQQARIARFQYRSIIAQLEDPNVEVKLGTTMFGARAPLNQGPSLKDRLASVARSIDKMLEEYISSKEPMTGFVEELAVHFDPSRLREQTRNVFELTFDVEILRTAFVDPLAERELPSVKSISWILPPDLNRTPDGALQADETMNIDLRAFAATFESAFVGFDGTKGRLLLAVRNGESDFGRSDAVPTLFGLRWSQSQGFHVAFEQGKVAYFTQMPITTKLVSQQVQVTVFDRELDPQTVARTFANIDLDTWGRSLLAALDTLMTPEIASEIVTASPDLFSKFTKTKRLLATTMRESLDAVYDVGDGAALTITGPRAAQDIVKGDIVLAKDRYEQHVLNKLSSAYDGSVVMQCFAAIQDNLENPPADDRTPRLFGGSVTNDNEEFEKDAPFTVSSARVAMTQPNGGGARPLNFIVSTSNPAQRALLDIDPLVWRAGFIEHQLAPEEAQSGYVPSTWLRLVETEALSVFDFNVGTYQAPSSVISFPAEPVLEQQSATQFTQSQTLQSSALFDWTYGSRIRKPERNANDTLDLLLQLNERIEQTALAASYAMPGDIGGKGDIPPLFAALANFAANWPLLGEMVQNLPPATATDRPTAEEILSTVQQVAWTAAAAWARFRGVPVPGEQDLRAIAPPTSAAPAERQIAYHVSFANAFLPNNPYLEVTSPDADGLWPSINGEAGEEAANGRRYPYTDDNGLLQIDWSPLNAFDYQTARITASIRRNSNLSSDGTIPVNPALIYETPSTTFANPVIPLLRINDLGPPIKPQTTLSETLANTLTELLMLGTVIEGTRIAKIESRYRYQLLGDPNAQGSGIASDTAVLLSENLEIKSADDEGTGVTPEEVADRIAADFDKRIGRRKPPVTPEEVAERIAADFDQWIARRKPPVTDAQIIQSLSVFAEIQGQKLPILVVGNIRYTVDPNWFP